MNYITPENTAIVALILIAISLTSIWLNKLVFHSKHQQSLNTKTHHLIKQDTNHVLIFHRNEEGNKLNKKSNKLK